MKKLTMSAVAALTVALVFSGLAIAKGPGLKATGGGKAAIPDSDRVATFGFNAQGEGDATDGKGRVNVNERHADGSLAQHFNGRVDCYFQDEDENYARFTGEVEVLELGSNSNPGMFFEVHVRDGGEPQDDQYRHRRSTTPLDCENNTQGTQFWNVDNGNIQVHQSGPPGRP